MASPFMMWSVVSWTGEILERQRDRVTGESKYRIRGETIDGSAVEVLAKISPTGKLVILTVYAM